MRIAFVSIHDPQDVSNWSGTPAFILSALRRHVETLEVIGPLNQTAKYLYAPYKVIEKLRGKGVHVDRHELVLRSYARQIERRIANRKFDAIITLSSIAIARLPLGIPVVFWTDATLEGMVNYYSQEYAGLSAHELRIGHQQEQNALDRAAYAVYSSEWTAQCVHDNYRIAPEKLQVIKFGANLSIDHDLAMVTQLIDARIARECVLLFIGVDWDRKGGAIAFETARILNERGVKTVLKVVGCRAPEAPFVEQLGFISKSTHEGQARIRELLETSTFFILPTRAEAAGIVFCEASGYGLPILATRTGGVESYVRDGETGFCLPLTAKPDEYANHIQSTLQNPETYRKLSSRAFAEYQQTLNWDSAVSHLLNLVRKARTKPSLPS